MQLFCGISELIQPHAAENEQPLDVTHDGALLVENGVLVAAGPRAAIEADTPPATGRIDLGGRAVVPGLVDSHTHAVFAGDRIDEMAQRCRGASYESIAAAGGGIVRSVAALRDTAPEAVVEQSLRRIDTMLARGTTTCEVKSGYGLEPELENKQLDAIAAMATRTPVQILATALAHVVPPTRRQDRAAHIERFCRDVLRPAAAAGRVRYCDVFVEEGAFTADEARRIAAVAKAAGVGLKLHVDQLHEGGGAALAAELGALSADHLDFSTPEGLQHLARAGVVATILPGCSLFLATAPWPRGRDLRDAGCEVAIATDCNPGSSMVTDLLLCATLGATRCGLSLDEALWAITRGGARALGLSDRGRLVTGERADFVVVDAPDWRNLLYRPASPPIHSVYIGGIAAWQAPRPSAHPT